MIGSIGESIVMATQSVELWPGSLLATGTPRGVGFSRTPPRFLMPGDVMCGEVDRIGTLPNAVG
jgi:2-keto-4-pentenoate hydratase/2-oxohepta-3-ene-1,7-dioic acid hydratase in catechol pathway